MVTKVTESVIAPFFVAVLSALTSLLKTPFTLEYSIIQSLGAENVKTSPTDILLAAIEINSASVRLSFPIVFKIASAPCAAATA